MPDFAPFGTSSHPAARVRRDRKGAKSGGRVWAGGAAVPWSGARWGIRGAAVGCPVERWGVAGVAGAAVGCDGRVAPWVS